MNFRVELELFRGPLDLLLYLVRKHEVEIVDIPIAAVAEQFLAYLEVLEQIDINAVGDFLEMASTLVEIKSRMVLPRGGEEEDEFQDPRRELVRQLLEYKRFKDAASMLEERSRNWQQRFPRLADDLPPRELNLAEQEIREVELWDLVSALGRIMRDQQTQQSSSIVYDDTPIHVHMQRIIVRLDEEQKLKFSQLFPAGSHKSTLVGVFLALLELVRHRHVGAEQSQLFGEIYICRAENADAAPPVDLSQVDNYEHPRRKKDKDKEKEKS